MGPKRASGLQGGRHERWCFTIPRKEHDDTTELKLLRLQENEQVLVYAVGKETGGQTGYPHWQGCIVFKDPKSARYVKELLTNDTHLEVMKGSTSQAVKYCMKEHISFQKNILSYRPIEEKVKERKQLKEQRAREIIKDAEQMGIEEFKEKWPMEWLNRRTTIEKMMVESMGRRAQTWSGKLQNKNFWIWGDPGVGKSRWAMNQGNMNNIMKKNVNKWWCTYSIAHTQIVIIEDYPTVPQGDYLQHHMKVWGDRYPLCGEVKNGATIVEPGRVAIIVTSNYPISRCFSHEEDVKAIERRFNQIQMTKCNRCLIEQLKVDLRQLTTGGGGGGSEEQQTDGSEVEISEEQQESIQEHLENVRKMNEESTRRAELGLDEMEEEW
jgi:hypothetical protein